MYSAKGLQIAISKKEKAESLLGSLENLRKDKTIDETQYSSMKNEYTNILNNANAEIAQIKSEISTELESSQKNLDIYNQELKNLDVRFKVGEYSAEGYRKSEKNIRGKIEKLQQKISELKRLLESKSSAELGGYVELQQKEKGANIDLSSISDFLKSKSFNDIIALLLDFLKHIGKVLSKIPKIFYIIYLRDIPRIRQGEKTIDYLILALGDKNRFVRVFAIEALGKIGNPRAIEPIRKLLNDPAEIVRNRAEEVLKSIEAYKVEQTISTYPVKEMASLQQNLQTDINVSSDMAKTQATLKNEVVIAEEAGLRAYPEGAGLFDTRPIGKLFLTNKRLIFLYSDATIDDTAKRVGIAFIYGPMFAHMGAQAVAVSQSYKLEIGHLGSVYSLIIPPSSIVGYNYSKSSINIRFNDGHTIHGIYFAKCSGQFETQIASLLSTVRSNLADVETIDRQLKEENDAKEREMLRSLSSIDRLGYYFAKYRAFQGIWYIATLTSGLFIFMSLAKPEPISIAILVLFVPALYYLLKIAWHGQKFIKK